MTIHPVHPLRITRANAAPVRARGADHVLYWMIAARRTRHNPALQHAVARAIDLDRPLIVLEPLRAGHPWASERLHRFVIDGMADNAAACAAANVAYLPYVEPEPGAGRGLLAALAARAACVITDEQPTYFLPRMVAAAAARLDVAVELVDGNGILPLRAATKAYPSAAAFRRFLQGAIHPHLEAFPVAEPLAALPRALRGAELPASVRRGWPAASAALLAGDRAALAALPIDHEVPPVPYRGGMAAAGDDLAAFVDDRLDRYAEARNHPDDDAPSGLSPYLHFGHVSAHEVVARVFAREGWTPARLAGAPARGQREGWWGMSPAAEAFLDQIITWRELGYGFAFHRDDHMAYGSLPAWARATLEAHAADPRPHLYTRDQLERAETSDPIWNAAQRQLRAEGRIHNYLRMLWGKKVLEWTRTPRAALAALIHLNDRWAVDGRDPNSYSGIFWILGRFDRPWPERPIYGVVRTMTSDSTRRKVRLDRYLARFGAQPSLL